MNTVHNFVLESTGNIIRYHTVSNVQRLRRYIALTTRSRLQRHDRPWTKPQERVMSTPPKLDGFSALAQYFPSFVSSPTDFSQECAFPWGIWTPVYYKVLWRVWPHTKLPSAGIFCTACPCCTHHTQRKLRHDN